MSLILLLACTGKPSVVTPDDSEPQVDDSDPPVDDSQPEDCLTTPEAISPKDGAKGVYYRSDLSVQFTDAVSTASFTVRAIRPVEGQAQLGSTGSLDKEASFEAHEPSLTVEWNASREIATLETDGLHANTRYALDIRVCGQGFKSTFSTDAYGDPLEIAPEDLVGHTFVVELSKVSFTEPAGFGSFLAVYLDVPILIGVVSMDGDDLDMLGAQGRLTSSGRYVQKKTQTLDDEQKYWVPTWDFSGVDFSQSPFWAGDTDKIELRYDGAFIPVYDFHIEGTFSPDGESFGGGRIWGLGDTRDMATLFNSDDEDYVCGLVETAGASCEVCPEDGEKYCLFLRGEDIEADRERGLVLEELGDGLYEE